MALHGVNGSFQTTNCILLGVSGVSLSFVAYLLAHRRTLALARRQQDPSVGLDWSLAARAVH